MGWFEGFPFVSKEERERRRRDFEKRVTPFGVEEQREKTRETLKGLFPDIDATDAIFAFFNAKDAYTYAETKEEAYVKAKLKLRGTKWIDGRTETVMLRFIELENEIASLDDYPTAADVLDGLFEE
ncbi:MAG: hypothetical protein FWH32_02995 [Clostridiales bacterium]|nr:hypothetical protein [Clostridiales bacterium]